MLYDVSAEADDVLALDDHRAPPRLLDVALELDAERSVVVAAVEAAVDLARLEDEAAPLAQRHDLVHQVGRRLRHRGEHGRCAAGHGQARAVGCGPARSPW